MAQKKTVQTAQDILIQNLQRMLRQDGVTGYRLARDNEDVSSRTVHDMLTGAHSPRLEKIEAVANALQVPVWALLYPGDEAWGDIMLFTRIYAHLGPVNKQILKRMFEAFAEGHLQREVATDEDSNPGVRKRTFRIRE